MMAEEIYTTIPETDIEGRDITDSFASILAGIIDRNKSLLAFPRLRFPLLKSLGYTDSAYHAIAQALRNRKIRVYETREQLEFNGKYCSDSENRNFFVISPDVTSTPMLGEGTLLHEVTHAVQDFSKWKISKIEMEVDAHFAEALYLVRSKKKNEAATDMVLTRFIIAAEQFDKDAKYFGSLDFRRLRQDMENDVYQHYQFMHSTFEANFDPAEFEKRYRKRRRLDGI